MTAREEMIRKAIKVLKTCETYEYPSPAQENKDLDVLFELAQSYLDHKLIELSKLPEMVEIDKNSILNITMDTPVSSNISIEDLRILAHAISTHAKDIVKIK